MKPASSFNHATKSRSTSELFKKKAFDYFFYLLLLGAVFFAGSIGWQANNVENAFLLVIPAAGALLLSFYQIKSALYKDSKAVIDSNCYESLFNNSHSVMLVIHPESGAILDANTQACHYYGYNHAQITCMTIVDINLSPARSTQAVMQKVTDSKLRNFDTTHKLANGQVRDVEVYSSSISLKGEQVLYSIVHDVTARNESEKEKELVRAELEINSMRLSRSYDILLKTLNSLDSIIYVSCLQSRDVLFMNDYAKKTFGEINPVKKKCWQIFQNDQSSPCAVCSRPPLLKDNKPLGVCAYEFQHKANGRWYQCRAQAIPWVDDRLVRVEVSVDITERKEAEAKALNAARYAATHDNLTTLPNRVLFMDKLSVALTAAQRNNAIVGILFFDLDGFKLVNDNYGHAVGDELLQLVSKRLVYGVRKADTVARFGGDEFAILLSPVKNKDNAELVAETIIKVLTRPFSIGTKQVSIGVSIGIALSSSNNNDADILLEQADSAMYSIKKRGKNGYCFYSDKKH